MNSTLMYYTISERALNYLSVDIKIIHVHREYIASFLLLGEDFIIFPSIF